MKSLLFKAGYEEGSAELQPTVACTDGAGTRPFKKPKLLSIAGWPPEPYPAWNGEEDA